MEKPLEGVKVVECGYFVAGPSAGMNLAEWGAEVVKVEPLFGDPGHKRDAQGNITVRDEYFNLYNRKVKDVAVNTKDPRGLEILDALMKDADVFLTSFRPQALAKMGMDWETVHAKYPRCIYAALNGFGEEGPQKDDPGYDTVAFWGRSGLTQDITSRGSDVVIPPVAFGDLLCGVVLAGAVGTALFQRERTGEGSKVSLSLYGLGLYATTYMLFGVQTGTEYPLSRLEPELPMMCTYKCADGRWLYMANVDHEKHYGDLMRALGRPELADDARYASRDAAQAHRVEFTKMMDAEFGMRTADEMTQILRDCQIPCTLLSHVKDNIDNPEQALANDYLMRTTMRDGMEALVPTTPIRYGSAHIEEGPGEGPLLGEHTAEVLTELGYTSDQLAMLQSEGVIIAR